MLKHFYNINKENNILTILFQGQLFRFDITDVDDDYWTSFVTENEKTWDINVYTEGKPNDLSVTVYPVENKEIITSHMTILFSAMDFIKSHVNQKKTFYINDENAMNVKQIWCNVDGEYLILTNDGFDLVIEKMTSEQILAVVETLWQMVG